MRLILSTILILGFASCTSSKLKEEVHKEVSMNPTIKTEKELNDAEDEILINNKNLTIDQKKDLTLLIEKTRTTNQEIQNEIMKTRSILFKELISNSSTSKAKIRILETQLYKLNKKKMRYSLSAYKEAKTILGKNDGQLEQTLMMINRRKIQEF